MSTAPLPVLPGYEVKRLLAKGGMAAVYAAVDTRSGRQVALKVILPEVADDLEFRSRFVHEVKLHSQLKHPNVLELFEFGEGAELFLSMELIDGGTLRTVLDNLRKLPPELALFVAAETLKGLGCAHERGIVHRDVKPQNVMVTRSGAVKVADFGISKTSQMTRLTQTGSVIGTPAYMSPEQAIATHLDARSDLFSVGVMLHEALTGSNPFLTDNPATTLRRIVDEEPPSLFLHDPSIPAGLEVFCEKLLKKRPDARFASAAAAVKAAEAELAAMGATDAASLFRSCLSGAGPWLAVRSARLATESLARAKGLAASGAASPEVLLWSAVLAVSHDPKGADARALYGEALRASGYRVERGAARPRTADLEARLRLEPDDPALLLQAAKAAKMDGDFLRLMRWFQRLRRMSIDDPYVLGQVTALVARPAVGARAPAETRAVPRA
jgi:serine/threonine-protein kinase